jgi:hypothetical protein
MGQFDIYTAAVAQTLTNKTISGSNNTLSNISLASSVTGTLPVANGGTGLTSPGTSGNVLTSNGTAWVSSAAASALLGQTDSATPFETSFGYQAGNVNTGVRNTFIGYQAGRLNGSAADNTAVGSYALENNTTGYSNSAFGSYALGGSLFGVGNCAFGGNALGQTAANFNNSAFGNVALYKSMSNNNSAFGAGALYNITTGDNNTAIGVDAGFSTGTNSNITLVGYQANPSSTSVSNEITLGNSSVTTLRCATTTITSLSDERDKKNIIDLPAGLNFINAVRPVAFDWNARDESKVDIPDTGFLAQNLQQVQAQLGVTIPGLVYDTNPEKLEAGYSKLLPVLVKAIQELSARIEALERA